MANLKEWILKQAEGETIEAVVIGEMGWGDFGSEEVPNYNKIPKGIMLSWKEVAPFLNFDFYDGYGSPGCMAIYVWTKNWIISVYQYDGSTSPYRIPRNPINCMPKMVGG